MFDLYETTPLWDYPELPGTLTVPGPNGTTIDMSGGRSDRPEIVGERKTGKKTKWGSLLLDMLPRMGTAALAGMATPNIAGGGPTDIARAAMAGSGELERRDNRRMTIEDRQRQIDQQEALRRAQEEMYGAHADLYRRQAENVRPPKTIQDKYDEAIRAGYTPEQARIIASGGSLQDKKPEKPEKTLKDKYDEAVAAGYSPEEAKIIASGGQLRQPGAARPDPAAQATAKLQAETNMRTQLADQWGLKGDARQFYIANGRLPTPRQGNGGGVEARQRQAALQQLERWKAEKDLDLSQRRTMLVNQARQRVQGNSWGTGGGQLPPEIMKEIDDELNEQSVLIDRFYREQKAALGAVAPSPGGVSVRPSGPPQSRPKAGAGANAAPKPVNAWDIALGQ